jgi:1-acyl-sn-glycerol-3-phosphate acyltransferase
MIILMMFINQK